MGNVIGELLPLAVGVAVSPIPIIAVILMLLAPRARGASIGFMLGWVVGIVGATAVFVVLSTTAGIGSKSEPSAVGSWLDLLLGALLVFEGFRQWRGRPAAGEPAHLPQWMRAIDSVTAVRAGGLGFLLAAVNPKNLVLCAAAGVAVAQGGLTVPGQVLTVAVYTVIAACTVAIPVGAYLVAAERMRSPLDRLKGWLERNNVAVMAVLLLVIGVDLIGKGIGGLT